MSFIRNLFTIMLHLFPTVYLRVCLPLPSCLFSGDKDFHHITTLPEVFVFFCITNYLLVSSIFFLLYISMFICLYRNLVRLPVTKTSSHHNIRSLHFFITNFLLLCFIFFLLYIRVFTCHSRNFLHLTEATKTCTTSQH